MPYVNKMYVTEIDEEFEGDTFFPIIDDYIVPFIRLHFLIVL